MEWSGVECGVESQRTASTHDRGRLREQNRLAVVNFGFGGESVESRRLGGVSLGGKRKFGGLRYTEGSENRKRTKQTIGCEVY